MNKKQILLFFILLTFGFTTYAQDSKFKLIVFEGSDWCSNCIRLETNVLSKPSFEAFIINKSIDFKRVDFPQRKQLSKLDQQRNAEIAEKYKFNGAFPTVLLIDESSNLIVKIPYQSENSEAFISLIQSKISLK